MYEAAEVSGRLGQLAEAIEAQQADAGAGGDAEGAEDAAGTYAQSTAWTPASALDDGPRPKGTDP